MDKIQESAVHFLNLVNTTSYIFHVANKAVRVILLNFMPRDFHHIAGLQHLTDIYIPRNKKSTLPWILNERHPITDKYLAQSKFYKGNSRDEKDIENRIDQLRFLEQYLDENNMIRIFSPKDSPPNNSVISCTIISFCVKKNVTYGGQKLYWMLKDKIVAGTRKTLYYHPGYTLEQKLKNEPSDDLS